MFSYKVEQISVKTSDQAPKQHMFILPVIGWPFVSISSPWGSVPDCNEQNYTLFHLHIRIMNIINQVTF